MFKIVLCFLFMAVFSFKAKSEDVCPPIDFRLNIDNRVQKERIRYDYNKTTKKLKEMSDKKDRKDILVRGLFSPEIMRKTDISWSFYSNGCIDYINVDLMIDFDSTIYVANEYPYGSDIFNYVLWHETEHSKITIENTRRYLNYLKKEMERYVRGIKIYPTKDANVSQKNIKYIVDKINQTINSNVDGINNHINKLQDAFDEKEINYKKNGMGK